MKCIKCKQKVGKSTKKYYYSFKDGCVCEECIDKFNKQLSGHK